MALKGGAGDPNPTVQPAAVLGRRMEPVLPRTLVGAKEQTPRSVASEHRKRIGGQLLSAWLCHRSCLGKLTEPAEERQKCLLRQDGYHPSRTQTPPSKDQQYFCLLLIEGNSITWSLKGIASITHLGNHACPRQGAAGGNLIDPDRPPRHTSHQTPVRMTAHQIAAPSKQHSLSTRPDHGSSWGMVESRNNPWPKAPLCSRETAYQPLSLRVSQALQSKHRGCSRG